MKTKNRWNNALTLAMAFLLPLSALAEGTRGGQVVNQKKRKVLRDLLDETNCDGGWKSGETVLKLAPETKLVLNKLAELDWYFAFSLEREIKKLHWCFTSKLIQIPGEDYDALTTGYMSNARQAALRLVEDNEVFVDKKIFFGTEQSPGLDQYQRAFLVLHETIHTYMDFDLKRRNKKVRDMIKTIELVYNGAPDFDERSELHYQMSRNGVSFPLQVKLLDANKDYIRYSLGDEALKNEILSTVDDAEKFFGQSADFPKFKDGLTSEDAQSMSASTSEFNVSHFCGSQNVKSVVKFLEQAQTKESFLKDFAACYWALSDKEKLKAVNEKKFQIAFMKKFAERLKRKKIETSDDRVSMDEIVTEIASTTSPQQGSFIPVLKFTGVESGNLMSLRASGYLYASLIFGLVKENQVDELNELLADENFSKAFDFKPLIADVALIDDTLPPPIPREKKMAIQVLKKLAPAYWAQVVAQIGDEQAKQPAYQALIDALKKLELI